MVLTIMAACAGFGSMLSYTGAVRKMAEAAVSVNIGVTGLVLLMGLVVLIFGTFMDSVPVMMIIIPIFYPIVRQIGIDPIWFATYMLIAIKIGNFTPPYGLLLFVMKGISPPGTKMADIYRSVTPIILIDCAMMVLIVVFPQIVLWLPSFVGK
jgi:TRAP-type C4-dicarboxylate transport system permease large subunit